MSLDDHPTVRHLRETGRIGAGHSGSVSVTADELRELARACGADDVGVVEIGRGELDPQRDEILKNYPWTRTLLSFVVKMAREPVRGAPRSVSNLEFHRAGHEVNEIAAHIVARLQDRGIRAVNPSMGFPMEMQNNPGIAIWIVSHKPVSVAAGLGRMGIHRNLIHPTFGNFVLLGTVLLDQEISDVDQPIDYNPCLECNLCVAVCPVGAIKADGTFNFQACFTHNYREFMGGFNDWVEQIADAKDAIDYRKRVNEPETASMWQSLTYGANYKSAYCLAVCPAGEDVIGPYLADKAAHRRDIVKPLQERPETVYVVAGTDAEDVARRKWKNKLIKPVGNGMTPRTISGLLTFMPIVFQPERSRGLDAVFHFIFTGAESRQATITVKDRKITVSEGLEGKADIRMTADAKTWLGFLAKEKNLLWALARRKIRISGDPRLLLAFGKCFPSPDIKRKPVEVVPEASLIVPAVRPYEKNDPATGKVRWYGQLRLHEVEQVTHNVKTFRFVNPTGGTIPFCHVAGQYLTLDIAPHGIATRRSYTIASPPTWRDRVEITVKREDRGLVSRWLHDDVENGALINVEAPSGTFVFSGRERPSVVLVGGGVGITPMMSIARYLTDSQWPGTIYLLCSFLTPEDFIFKQEIEFLRLRNPRLQVAIAITHAEGTNWSGATGYINAQFIQTNVPDIALHLALICGPTPMMDAVKATLIELGVPASQIKTEAFGTDKRDPTKTRRPSHVVATVTFLASHQSAKVREEMSLLNVADEAGVFIDSAWLCGFDAYRANGKGKDAGFWLKGKDGSSHRVLRVGSDPIEVASVAVSVCGGIQPEVLRGMYRDLGADGMLQRFLVFHVAGPVSEHDLAPDLDAIAGYRAVAEKLWELRGAGEFMPSFRFAPEADQFRREVVAFQQREIRAPDAPAGLCGWLDKLEGEWARIALMFHLIDWADGVESDALDLPLREIGPLNAERAFRFLTEYVFPHELFVHRCADGRRGPDSDAVWIAGYILSHGSQEIRQREILRANASLKKSQLEARAKRVAAAMGELCEAGWARRGEARNDSALWTINPAVHQRFPDIAIRERARRAHASEKIREAGAARRVVRDLTTGGA